MENENDKWISLIMIDKLDWDSCIGPTHIMGMKDEKKCFLPVFIGLPPKYVTDLDLVGIYIKTNDYDYVDHSKVYVFFHDPCLENTDSAVFDNIKLESVKEEDVFSVSREHLHIVRSNTTIEELMTEGIEK